MRVTFGVLKQTKRQISSECVHSVGFRWPKAQFLANFDFWGRLDRFILWRRKTPIFAIFWTSAFSDVDSWRQSEKVEHG